MKNLFYVALGVFLGYQYRDNINNVISNIGVKKLPEPFESARNILLQRLNTLPLSELPTTNNRIEDVRREYNLKLSYFIIKSIPVSRTYAELVANAKKLLKSLKPEDILEAIKNSSAIATMDLTSREIEYLNAYSTQIIQDFILRINRAENPEMTNQEMEYNPEQQLLAAQPIKELQALQTQYASLEDCNNAKFNSTCTCRPYRKAVSGSGSGVLQPTFYKMDCTKITVPIN